ncbi:hypothetical protein HR17_01925 [Porphyromonas gulae]|uniref:AAA family ATPase n=1 Tax=Porphyromonas gulae TaxID=111105 RepID=UPI00052C0C10|nr:AAA family ATPase [Porphyromonas gulae]KGN76540.1 hypothetical protein HR17_01925 [Porphyromonas gulae]KGO03975.1 hypothetical protein HR16_07930 [Porphyromonas gulae]
MFENFKKIKIKGGYFDEETELELFKGDAPLSIIYGRNGSGKSTIALCLKQLSESEEERAKREEVPLDKEIDYTVSSEIPIADKYKRDVFVFDEDFVQNNVRVKNDGLNAIVMLGEQVELDEKINKKNEELKKKEEEFNQQEEQVRKYEDTHQIISPEYWRNQIREGLRKDGGWADIDRDLKRNKLKSRITDDLLKKLMEMEEPPESCEQLREQVVADKSLYLESENSQVIVWSIGELTLPENLEDLTLLLEKPLDSPQLTEREQRLMDLLTKISQEPQRFEQSHTRHMLEGGWTFCPLCLREITKEDRVSIDEILSHLLNKEADDFNTRLSNECKLFTAIETEMPEFPNSLNKTELDAAITAKTKLNNVLAIVREKIEQRQSDIYKQLQTPFIDKMDEYTEARIAWKTALDCILERVEIFNETINRRNKLLAKVSNENNQLARKELASALISYRKALDNELEDKNKLQKLKEQKDELVAAIKELKMQKERTDIALEYINKQLQYVFYSNRKVKLTPGEGCYKLTVNGKEVKPKKISVGERNVLGLCYFFAMLFSGKSDEDKYTSEYLIVIDDPISSFDYGNRLGVMSLLRYQFGNIKKGNPNSRLLVMSHDLQSVFDLVKIKNDLQGGRGEKKFLELENKKIREQTVRNEYQKLLTHVYEYANCECLEDLDETVEMGIGNIMRRMLEAFSSFCYNKPFETMMRMEGIISNMSEDKRVYYENFMCRLALNGESHEEERAYTLSDFTPFFSKEEKLQTAKSVLLFLLYVNEPHIKAYLKPEMVARIESWKSEESSWIATESVTTGGSEST